MKQEHVRAVEEAPGTERWRRSAEVGSHCPATTAGWVWSVRSEQSQHAFPEPTFPRTSMLTMNTGRESQGRQRISTFQEVLS